MRVKEGYMLRKVAGKYIVIAIGEEAVDFNGLITTNETGAFLWEKLENNTDENQLLKAMLSEYDIDEKTAAADIALFINKLKAAELILL